MNNQARDDFEFGGEPLKVTVTVRGSSRDYFFHDLSKREADKLYAPIAAAGEDAEKKLIANREIVVQTIAAVVRRQNGTRITEDEAYEMRAALSNKLALKCMAFLNDGDVNAAGERKVDEEESTKKD